MGSENEPALMQRLISPVYGFPCLQHFALLFSQPVPPRATQERFSNLDK